MQLNHAASAARRGLPACRYLETVGHLDASGRGGVRHQGAAALRQDGQPIARVAAHPQRDRAGSSRRQLAEVEVAAAARQAGLQVTVLETLDLPLLRVLGREMAQVFADLHRSNGVSLRLGVRIEEVLSSGSTTTPQATTPQACGVRLADGARIDADAILAGIGAVPRTGLASDAGLEVSDGIVTTAALRTSDPDIFAAGDVASAFHPLLGEHVRVEHWANALKQPAVAAAAMLGQEASYEDLPYFYTDQYDLGMEYVGHVSGGGYDQVVVRGDLEARQFIAFWLKEGRVKAGMNVNVWDVTDSVKALIRSGHPVDAHALADPGTALDDLLPG